MELLDLVTKLSLFRVSATLSRYVLLREAWKLSGQGTRSLKSKRAFLQQNCFLLVNPGG